NFPNPKKLHIQPPTNPPTIPKNKVKNKPPPKLPCKIHINKKTPKTKKTLIKTRKTPTPAPHG
ncbi:hypothetical protein ACQWF3_24665, partial [Salmonella enterica subsp. enterica serovar Infantis]